MSRGVPCPKCGGWTMVRYCAGNVPKYEPGYACAGDCGGRGGEHLNRICNSCGYRWRTECDDARPQTGTLETYMRIWEMLNGSRSRDER